MARFISHARSQMAARGISTEEVEAVLSNHDTTYPSSHGKGRHVFVGEVAGRRIAVIATPDDVAGTAVITAWCPEE
jgi:uncharacterized DUF497 family protein